MASFPTSVVSNTDPTSSNTLNSPDHAGLHSSHNAEIGALETKVGTGASAPASNTLLIGTGAGTSSWSAITSAQLAARVTDETGSGALVFGTAPTISAPVVSTGTFASPVITTPSVITSINDANGNEVIKTPATASAVNELTITNAGTGVNPILSATGNDTNIGLTITPKGSSGVVLTNRYDGWTTGLTVPTSVAYNGQRTYTLTYASSIASYKSPGMKSMFTRTVAAPTQVTALSGTKYWSKATPNKFSWTDDFVIDVVVNPTSYALGTIASCYNGTSGFALRMNALGQILMIGYNAGAANFSQILSYASLTLNRETRVTAQLDMSSFTNSATTSYIMLDGVDVPGAVSRGGTNPTALIQAGNLNVGAENGGTNPFQGNISQLAIFNAKVTQAQILTYHGQGYAGTETSIASAYSFNGVATDLNTTTPNDLTAQNSAGYATGGTFGNRGVSSNLEYCKTTAVAANGLTETVFVPEGCTLPTSGGITSMAYSVQTTPYGFPAQRSKWLVISKYKMNQSTTINLTTAQLTGFQFVLPVGDWRLTNKAYIEFRPAAGGVNEYTIMGLSTATGSFSGDLEDSIGMTTNISASTTETDSLVFTQIPYTTTAQTTVYGIAKTPVNGAVSYGNFAGGVSTYVEAELGYL